MPYKDQQKQREACLRWYHENKQQAQRSNRAWRIANYQHVVNYRNAYKQQDRQKRFFERLEQGILCGKCPGCQKRFYGKRPVPDAWKLFEEHCHSHAHEQQSLLWQALESWRSAGK